MGSRQAVTVALVAAALLVAACGGSGDDGTGQAQEADDELRVSTADWPETDFSKHSVPLSEFRGGGPPKDGIPSIDDPKLISTREAAEFLAPDEPVAVVEVGRSVRAYPLQILVWHEIVNDELAGQPIAVTYCPLCNSTVAFSREVDGRVLEFGTTGNLRKSDLVMYDRTTESWWQQLTADAVVGELTGTELDVIPSRIAAWEDFLADHPGAEVLSRDTGFDRDYGASPYPQYDASPGQQPFLLEEEVDGALPPKERVTAVQTGESAAVVYPFGRLRDERVVNDEIEGRPVVVMFDPEVGSVLNAAEIGESENTGAGAVYERRVQGRTLTFEAQRGADEARFRDRETGSTWDMRGRAVSGPLSGAQLDQIASDDQFWFAIAAFVTDPDVRAG